MERVRLFVFTVINVLNRSRILLANWSKSRKSCFLICVSFVTGVGMNLRPLPNRLICSFVSTLSERILICFLFVSKREFNYFLCFVFLR